MADNPDTLRDIILLAVGATLGQLGVFVSYWIGQRRRKNEFEKAFQVESEELRSRFVNLVFQVKSKRGLLDTKTVNWVIKNAPDGEVGLVAVCKGLLAKGPGATGIFSQVAKGLSMGGFSPKKYHLPFFESHVGDLTLLDTDTQRLLLDIRQQLGFFNELVEDARNWLNMTFQGLDAGNHQRAERNLDATYDTMCDRATLIAERIISLQVP